MTEKNASPDSTSELLLTALRYAGAGPAGVERAALTAAIEAATDRQMADVLLAFLRESEVGKGAPDWQVMRLISAAVAVSHQCCENLEKDAAFAWAMQLLATKKARLELRIAPLESMRSVVGELIQDDDGSRIAVLFELQAREPTFN